MTDMKPEVYVSVDIESDGPIPGPYSMLNFGAAAFLRGREAPVSVFERNLAPLEGATQDPDTMGFWAQNQEAWEYVNKDPVAPEEGIKQFREWLQGLPGRPVLVTYPSWDYMWIRWYMVRFLGHDGSSILGLAGLDMKSYAMACMGHPSFHNTSKKTMTKFAPQWFENLPPHDHTGLADAIEQGITFIRMMRSAAGEKT